MVFSCHKDPSIVLIPTLGISNDLQGCGVSVFDLGQSSVHHKDPDVLNNPNSNFNVCSDIKHLHPLVNPEPLWVQLLTALRRNLVPGALGEALDPRNTKDCFPALLLTKALLH